MLSNRFRGITFWHPARELLRTCISRTSENYPSRDCLEIPNGHRFGFLRACPMGRKGASRQRFALPNPRRPIPPAIFQTVSLETVLQTFDRLRRRLYKSPKGPSLPILRILS